MITIAHCSIEVSHEQMKSQDFPQDAFVEIQVVDESRCLKYTNGLYQDIAFFGGSGFYTKIYTHNTEELNNMLDMTLATSQVVITIGNDYVEDSDSEYAGKVFLYENAYDFESGSVNTYLYTLITANNMDLEDYGIGITFNGSKLWAQQGSTVDMGTLYIETPLTLNDLNNYWNELEPTIQVTPWYQFTVSASIIDPNDPERQIGLLSIEVPQQTALDDRGDISINIVGYMQEAPYYSITTSDSSLVIYDQDSSTTYRTSEDVSREYIEQLTQTEVSNLIINSAQAPYTVTDYLQIDGNNALSVTTTFNSKVMTTGQGDSYLVVQNLTENYDITIHTTDYTTEESTITPNGMTSIYTIQRNDWTTTLVDDMVADIIAGATYEQVN